MSLIEQLKDNRPKLTVSSLRTYNSILKNLAKSLDFEPTRENFISNRDNIMKHLKETDPKKRKTILASIIVLLDNGKDDETVDTFREKMMSDVKQAEDEVKEQKLTDKQKENWLSWDEVEKVYKDLEKETKALFKIDNLKPSAKMRLQDYVMLSCLMLIPPRRSLDWADFKIKNIDEDKDNYLLKDKLVFNSYKTKKYYGKQTIDIAKNPLKKILNDWIKIQDGDYLFTDTKGNYLSPTKLTFRLYSLFNSKGKKISTSMLRHIFITDKVLPNIPKLTELEKQATDMGHSLSEQMKYKKFDTPDEEEPIQKAKKTRSKKTELK
jgi:hypothetical protein